MQVNFVTLLLSELPIFNAKIESFLRGLDKFRQQLERFLAPKIVMQQKVTSKPHGVLNGTHSMYLYILSSNPTPDISAKYCLRC